MKKNAYLRIVCIGMLLISGCSVFRKKEKREDYMESKSKATSFREAMHQELEYFGGKGLSGYLPFLITRDSHVLPLPREPNSSHPYKIESGDMLLEFVRNDTGIKFTAVPKPVARSNLRYDIEKVQNSESDTIINRSWLYNVRKEMISMPAWAWLIIILGLFVIYKIIRREIKFPF